MSQIRFENVNYIYSGGTTFEKQALKDVSFAVESGSFIGVIGHTGSGKSTLIQHMNGLIRPTSGKIYFHDEDITADGYKKKELRSKVGIVFQYPEYQLFEIDVLADVAFGPKNLGLSQEEAKSHIRQYMDGLPHEIFGRYKELEKMGLSAPKMTYLMHSLAEKGYDLSTDILTVSDAAEEILNLWRKTRMEDGEK